VLGDLALDEEGAGAGIEADGEQVERRVERARAQLVGADLEVRAWRSTMQ